MVRGAAKKVKADNERGARRELIEELFYDFHTSRREVYWMNFFRGVFFGVGSIIGGTIVLAVVLGLLNLLVDLPGGVGDFIEYIMHTVEQRRTP